MQYTLNELIARLEQLRNELGGDTRVYGYGVNDWKSFNGVDCYVLEYDDCDEKFVELIHD